MNDLFLFFNSNIYNIFLIFIIFVLLVLYIINTVKLRKLRKSYKEFMIRLGKGTNIDEQLNLYMQRVEEIEKENKEIKSYCDVLEKEKQKCLQKIGLVRYSAFKDMGSDLSFAVAILDELNDGIVFNGIYSREMSNIYAKPIEKGKSKYTLSEEEKEALNKAINI